jgi:hypothetical protein
LRWPVDLQFRRQPVTSSHDAGTHWAQQPRFSARLRDQIDLDTLAAELHAVVDQTMQPTTASLWLRPAPTAGAATPTGQPPQ